MSPKKWSKNTFGWARAEVLGALINAVFLLALCFSIFIESLKRFFDPESLHKPLLVLYVGIIGLIVNVIGLFLFHGKFFLCKPLFGCSFVVSLGHGHSHGGHGHSHGSGDVHDHRDDARLTDPVDVITDKGGSDSNLPSNGGSTGNGSVALVTNGDNKCLVDEKKTKIKKKAANMNMHGVFLHVLADALGSVIVIISALIVYYTNWRYNVYVDPALSVIMVLIISYTTLPLCKFTLVQSFIQL